MLECPQLGSPPSVAMRVAPLDPASGDMLDAQIWGAESEVQLPAVEVAG